MAIPQREQRILLQKSGNRCAFRDCRRILTSDSSTGDKVAVLGEMAHIVGESTEGPRGDSPLTLEERNTYANLVLLCNYHHQLIDDQPYTYTVEKLLQIKKDHEDWVEHTLGKGLPLGGVPNLPPSVKETVYSTLLVVERMPARVYGAPCDLRDAMAVKASIQWPKDAEVTSFILRDGKLFTFHNIIDPTNPFSEVVTPKDAVSYSAIDWWNDPDRMRWYIELLNRSLNRYMSVLGLTFDLDHHRFYFRQLSPGQERKISYRPLNQSAAERSVVWQPKSRLTGLPRGDWYHRAVSLRFQRIGTMGWYLSIRPELHITVDGVQPPPPLTIGAKVTRRKSRTFNYDLLGEVQFWRDFLSRQKSYIALRFGGQSLVMRSHLGEGEITWPGIPEEHAKPFKNVYPVDDLWVWAERMELERNADLDSEDADYEGDVWDEDSE